MPTPGLLTSAGWTLDGLVSSGERFRAIPRVPASDPNLDAVLRKHEESGIPLVIEGLHERSGWPSDMFNTDWLRENGQQYIQVRNIHDRSDSETSFEDFLSHVGVIGAYTNEDETCRLYAKDAECPPAWKRWLETVSLIPRRLCPHGPTDIMKSLPESSRVESLMCYLGTGDTFTPCHKDLCASSGHNLMCYTEDDACAFWFMTDSSAAPQMATYFQSLGQELDMESYTMSVEEFAEAPCDVYIAEQRVGDFVFVPPRSCHQVVNHGGLTVKMSWSRMTIAGARMALRHELPIYRRVCRSETYRIKATIHHTLRRDTALLEDYAPTKNGDSREALRKQLADDVQVLLGLLKEVMLDEYHPNAPKLHHVVKTFDNDAYDAEGYPTFHCDFCGSDIFVSFYCCTECPLSMDNMLGVQDGLHICPGCYAEGRTCRCGDPMQPMQCWPFRTLYADYNRAVRALKGIGINEIGEVMNR
ncbi:hypothetical protein BC834DRAFT_816741 [Gloeopeniophorella convolvens]|nr:hypothetical protein BC834DRAFT_816741 [Gloeopeniophorella convolvens]